MKETITPPDRSSVNDPLIVHCRGEGRNPNEIYRSRSHKRSKRKHRRPRLLSKIVLLLIIVSLFGGVGFGTAKYLSNSSDSESGSGNGGGEQGASAIVTAENTVVINGESIYYGNEKIDSIEALKSRIFADYDDGETFIVEDNRAIKDTYDSVINMFRDISVPYVEK